jgi:hypothetical protein
VRQRNLQNFGEHYEFYQYSDDFEGCFEAFELRVGISEDLRYESSSSAHDGSSDESEDAKLTVVEKAVDSTVGQTVKSDVPVPLIANAQHASAEATTSNNCIVS